ncbi:hypothetical protein L6452_17826 [Arctium lappa]|uniref:Uncharacterized protein n=1 Tax=Arctium lappa TaxID=4217 RepID=A0ACB9C4N0_ARCLA|nr:hypothetical protein L6452_17826 [Arctium lappa]
MDLIDDRLIMQSGLLKFWGLKGLYLLPFFVDPAVFGPIGVVGSNSEFTEDDIKFQIKFVEDAIRKWVEGVGLKMLGSGRGFVHCRREEVDEGRLKIGKEMKDVGDGTGDRNGEVGND